MTKQTKIIVGVVSVGVVLICITLFFLMPRGSDLTIQAPPPPREVTPALLPPPIPSVIAVRANLPIQDVKTVAESALRDYLSKPIQRKDGAIESAIKLNLNSLTMTGTADGTVSVNVPFRFSGWARVSKKIFGQVVQKREDIEGTATASLTLTPTLNSDWRITAKTTSDISIQKAEIEILGITISVRRILTELVRETVLPKLENLIVKYITNIDVKTRVAGLWTKLYEPIVLNQEPPIALTIEPLRILAQHLSSDGETLSFSLGIETYIQANMGDVLTDSPNNTIADLPDIRFVDALESGYHIIAPIEMTYAAVENLAKPHVEKPHKLKGVDTLVRKLTLYGSGTQLAAGIEFSMPSLGAEGQLYLLGTPVYDATTMSVSVTEFDYTLTTQSLLLDIAQAAGEGFFPNLRTTVEEKLVFPLEDRLTTLHKKLADVIAERRIGSYVVLRGTVDTITPEALYLTQTGVHIPFRLQGDLTCEVNISSSRFP
jgi:CheY-like chemotaxis protein